MTLADLHRSFAERPYHVSPFLMLGDPSPALTLELARAAVEGGATMLELGMPYSDPSADGPAIQEACLRAMQAGVSTGRALELIAELRAACPGVPMNLLVYGNLVHARGYARFCADAAAAGASTLLVPDVPLEEGEGLRAACADAGLGVVQLVAPLTKPERLRRLAAVADGFLYLAAHQGVTGAVASIDGQRNDLVQRVAAAVERPVCLGFGLGDAAQVRDAFAAGARIAVIGSHLARAIEAALPLGAAAVLPAFRKAFAALIPESISSANQE